MKINGTYPYIVLLALAVSAFSPAPSMAQGEDEEEDSRFGRVFAEAEAWVAQASGLDYFPATYNNPVDPSDVRLLGPEYSTETKFRVRAGYELAKNRGGLAITYYGHEELLEMTGITPGNFDYGTTLAHPFFAGFYNDGFADGFHAETATVLRDMRIDYYRTAFSNPRAIGKWYIGVRRVEHSREIEVQYFALVPELPALIPPYYTPPQGQIGLVPQPDTAYMTSEFEGRGISAGLDVALPLWKNKVLLEGGVGMAVLRGKTDTDYRSTTWYYIHRQSGEIYILEPPYDEFNESITAIEQLSEDYALQANRLSTTAYVMEAYAGVRWKIWRGIELFGGFRNARYTDVGVDLRANATPNYSGTSLAVDEKDRSATYEGFYTGVGYRF
jgi:hypothetical protein